MPGVNYIEVSKLLPSTYRRFIFLDSLDCSGNAILRWYQLPVKVKAVYLTENENYQFVICDIKKYDVLRFAKAMQELRNKMYILGRKDYDFECQKLFSKINNQ